MSDIKGFRQHDKAVNRPARRRGIVTGRRREVHPFVPQAGTPSLCSACNAREDELNRGERIHV